MARSFFSVDRDQLDLFPQSLSEMVSEDNLCHLIIDVVDQLDLRPLLAKYKDGTGQKAYHPHMMVALLLLSYCLGVRSSRKIEILCRYDVRFRMVACNAFPDHSSIARFRQKMREQLSELFVSTLELCREAGLGKVGAISIDGTKVKANAAKDANSTRAGLAKQVERILEEAEQIDAREDAQAASTPCEDELPDNLRTRASRAAVLRAAKDRMKRIAKAYEKADGKAREKIRQYDEKIAKRQAKQDKTGHKAAGWTPKFPSEDDLNDIKANRTDPESELMKSTHGFVQGYNAQIAVSQDGLIVAAQVVTNRNDQNLLAPMVQQVQDNLAQTGGEATVRNYLGDAGYWSPMSLMRAEELLQSGDPSQRPELLIACPEKWQQLSIQQLEEPLEPDAPLLHRLEYRQRARAGQRIYRNRGTTVEPVIGQIKSGRQCGEFMQRGLSNVDAEWDLICLTHNLLKLHGYQMAKRN